MKILEGKNISKYFPGVIALQDVNISINSGEIHCIIGENGAGKSTLIKCLTGIQAPERGSVEIEGTDAYSHTKLFKKIAYAPQEINLFPYLSVAENLFLPYKRSGHKGLYVKNKIEKDAINLLKKFNINVSPSELVKNISVSQQQLLQIARAMVLEDYQVLLLDEPTTSLTTADTKLLFKILKQLKEEGKAIVFISHKLEEIFALGDIITVFRNGEKVAYSEIKNIDINWIIKQMTGHEIILNQTFESYKINDRILMEVKNLTGEQFTDCSFNLKSGEILGFAGLVGAGRSELMQAIFGYLPIYKGSIKINNKDWKFGDTNHSIKNGLVYLPEERKSQGILADLSIKENISVSILDSLINKGCISSEKEKTLANKVIHDYDIKTPGMNRKIKYLSGGNQQKVIIGRAMCCNPKILIFDEPTKGIDVGTKSEIYKMMKQLAENTGIGIILISSEMDEVLKCSNRIITLYNGKITGNFTNPQKQQVMSAIIGVN